MVFISFNILKKN